MTRGWLLFVLPISLAVAVATNAEAWQNITNNGARPRPTMAPTGMAPQAIPGNTGNPELEFVTIAPCRAFDTHASAPLAAERAFVVSGSGNLRSQGGPRGGCGVPVWATAVAISLTASSDSGSGSIAAYPTGRPATQTAAVSFNTAGPQTAGVSVAINSHQLTLKPTSGGSAEVAGDVTGYYAPQLAAVIGNDGRVVNSTGRVVQVTHEGTGVYYVQFDRDISTCVSAVNIDGGAFYASGYNEGNIAYVETWSLNSTGQADYADLYFTIAVHC